MRKQLAVALVVAAALVPAARGADEVKEFKFAYVDMERVLTEFVLFTEAQKDATNKIKAAQENDRAKLDQYQTDIDALEKKLGGPLAPEAKAQTEADYKAKVEEALAYRDSLVSSYKQIERDCFEPVYKKVYDKVDAYAQRKSYDAVFDYSAVLLFADKKYDVSEDVIKELNEEAGVSTPGNP
jgi:Skp family chaperone for outer membrane proteins